MSRVRPVELELATRDDPELLARMAAVAAAGSGWINVRAVIEEEYEPPPPGPLAFLGGSTHKVPVVTWLPGRRSADGTPGTATVGLQHATGPRVARRLADVGLPLPDGWRVTQDHPRRGLVASVPAGTEDAAVVDWLLQAAAAVCPVPSTGRWTVSIHAGGRPQPVPEA